MTTFAHTANMPRETRQPRETLFMNGMFGRGIPAFAAYELTGESSMDGLVRCEYANHRFLERTVVIRRLMPAATGRAQRYYTFLQEIHAQALLRHARIAQVFDAGIYDEQPYAVLEQPRGATLDQQMNWLAENRMAIDVHDALTIIDELADFVAYAHRQGVRVHNLTPANIVLTEDGMPVLETLGSLEAPEQLRASEERLAFTAPELLSGALSDHRSDIYALGALLYFVLTGQTLFAGDVGKMQSSSLALIGLPSNLDTEKLQRVIRKATAPHLADRYASVEAFRRELAAVVASVEAEEESEEEAEPLLEREFGGGTTVVYQPVAPARRPHSQPATQRPPAAAPSGAPLADPSGVPGADREEFRAALPYTILVPLAEAPGSAGTATLGAVGTGGAVAAETAGGKLTWLSVLVVVAIALGTALMLG
jgi:eukaryotic-like serine/threonine-protein kinase